jgi:uncharacterized protein with FMN-binding domain
MRRTILATFGTIIGLVMLLSFKTHGSAPGRLAALGNTGSAGSTGDTPPNTPASTPPPTAGAATAAAPPATGHRVINGQTIDTQYGPVQLEVTFVGRRIVKITPLQLPSGQSRDDEINSYAIPVLDQEALQAQSAHIDTVSGATYTSGGYAQSLQSALDRASA